MDQYVSGCRVVLHLLLPPSSSHLFLLVRCLFFAILPTAFFLFYSHDSLCFSSYFKSSLNLKTDPSRHLLPPSPHLLSLCLPFFFWWQLTPTFLSWGRSLCRNSLPLSSSSTLYHCRHHVLSAPISFSLS